MAIRIMTHEDYIAALVRIGELAGDSPACDDCQFAKHHADAHPYGEGSAIEYSFECGLADMARPNPADCQALVEDASDDIDELETLSGAPAIESPNMHGYLRTLAHSPAGLTVDQWSSDCSASLKARGTDGCTWN